MCSPILPCLWKFHKMCTPPLQTTRSVYHQNKASIVFVWGQKNKKGVRESKNWKWCEKEKKNQLLRFKNGSTYYHFCVSIIFTTSHLFFHKRLFIIGWNNRSTTDLGQGKSLINHFKFRHSSPQIWKQGNTCQQKLQGREILLHKHPLCKKKVIHNRLPTHTTPLLSNTSWSSPPSLLSHSSSSPLTSSPPLPLPDGPRFLPPPIFSIPPSQTLLPTPLLHSSQMQT